MAPTQHDGDANLARDASARLFRQTSQDDTTVTRKQLTSTADPAEETEHARSILYS